MSKRKRNVALAMAGVFGFISIVAFSKPGRTLLARELSFLTTKSISTSQNKSGVVESADQTSQDVEQRARARHGWVNSITNSVVDGVVTFYNSAGTITSAANLKVYRAYPDQLRVELDRGGVNETVGFNQSGAWQASAPSISESRARDIRAWLRIWPERLFTTRGAGASYSEPGPRLQSSKPGRPWQGPTHVVPPVAYDQVQIEDVIGSQSGRMGDRRLIIYSVNRSTATIESARWLEPDDPAQTVSDTRAPKTDERVDFGDWRIVAGVLWPFEIVHWMGGKVDYRVIVTQVQTNQSLTGGIFQKP